MSCCQGLRKLQFFIQIYKERKISCSYNIYFSGEMRFWTPISKITLWYRILLSLSLSLNIGRNRLRVRFFFLGRIRNFKGQIWLVQTEIKIYFQSSRENLQIFKWGVYWNSSETLNYLYPNPWSWLFTGVLYNGLHKV